MKISIMLGDLDLVAKKQKAGREYGVGNLNNVALLNGFGVYQ